MCGLEGVHLIRFLLVVTKKFKENAHTSSFLSSLFSSLLPPLSYPPFSFSRHLQADNSFPPNKEVLEALKTIPEVKPYMKKLMPFVQHTKVRVSCSRETPKRLGKIMYSSCGTNLFSG